MRIIEKYVEILDACFDEPPKKVPEHCQKIMCEYPVDVVSVDDKAFMMVVKINEGFYGVSWVCVAPDLQRQGYGRKLLNKIHDKYQGVFIVKARVTGADQFYEKCGYTKVYSDKTHAVLVFVNDVKKVIF